MKDQEISQLIGQKALLVQERADFEQRAISLQLTLDEALRMP